MASGAPIIASDIDAYKEILTDEKMLCFLDGEIRIVLPIKF